jgi:pentapeptide repeat protein
VSGRGLPVLAPGDEIRLGGHAYRVVALDGTSVRLADVTGAATVMLTGHLLADPGFELVTSHRRVPLAVSGLDRLPEEVRAGALWWEQHLAEVLTGVRADAVPGTVPCPEYDPRLRSLRQRELAKHAALTAAGHEVALSTLQRLRRRYELEGIWGLVDRRYAPAGRGAGPGGRVDPRVVEAARRAISEQTDRSTGTVGRLRRRVGQLLAEDPDPPPMPPERTFYRLVARLSAGRHTFGSARTRRSLAKQPEGPFGAVTAARPGEWTQIDSTPLDVRVVLDDGLVDRVELTGLVDQATRTLAAAVLRPTTKAVDASLLLARAQLNRADLTAADLSGANLTAADLSPADLRDANLANANLTGANLTGAHLGGANLGGANLPEAYLGGANLSSADLGGANLYGADLTGAQLGGANLNGADLGGADLGGAIWSRGRPPPDDWKLDTGSGRLVAASTDSGPAGAN